MHCEFQKSRLVDFYFSQCCAIKLRRVVCRCNSERIKIASCSMAFTQTVPVQQTKCNQDDDSSFFLLEPRNLVLLVTVLITEIYKHGRLENLYTTYTHDVHVITNVVDTSDYCTSTWRFGPNKCSTIVISTNHEASSAHILQKKTIFHFQMHGL